MVPFRYNKALDDVGLILLYHRFMFHACEQLKDTSFAGMFLSLSVQEICFFDLTFKAAIYFPVFADFDMHAYARPE